MVTGPKVLYFFATLTFEFFEFSNARDTRRRERILHERFNRDASFSIINERVSRNESRYLFHVARHFGNWFSGVLRTKKTMFRLFLIELIIFG